MEERASELGGTVRLERRSAGALACAPHSRPARGPNEHVSILVAGDHPRFVAGLRALLETDPDVHLVAVARTGEEAVELARRERPNIVLMDLQMPQLSASRRKYPHVLASGQRRTVRGILSSREGALMPRSSPYRIELSDEERTMLESLARSYTLPYWQVVRAQMVLLAADGLRNDEIAGPVTVPARGCLTVAQAVLRAAPRRARGPATARTPAGLSPLRSALR